jgi:hypothetical protein
MPTAAAFGAPDTEFTSAPRGVRRPSLLPRHFGHGGDPMNDPIDLSESVDLTDDPTDPSPLHLGDNRWNTLTKAIGKVEDLRRFADFVEHEHAHEDAPAEPGSPPDPGED